MAKTNIWVPFLNLQVPTTDSKRPIRCESQSIERYGFKWYYGLSAHMEIDCDNIFTDAQLIKTTV